MSARVVTFSDKGTWDAAYDALVVRQVELHKLMQTGQRFNMVQTLLRQTDDALGEMRGFDHAGVVA